ncbi:hypothetical protein Syun_009596 [Stephania yunnanensis]|uniref:Uncharacterized protein n=1 Tax=Stephania yunnanensis TaxID=152371 RepID=A0AAP0KEX8_9MAGN
MRRKTRGRICDGVGWGLEDVDDEGQLAVELWPTADDHQQSWQRRREEERGRRVPLTSPGSTKKRTSWGISAKYDCNVHDCSESFNFFNGSLFLKESLTSKLGAFLNSLSLRNGYKPLTLLSLFIVICYYRGYGGTCTFFFEELLEGVVAVEVTGEPTIDFVLCRKVS